MYLRRSLVYLHLPVFETVLGETSSPQPSAISIPPSEQWDGNDGWWSTFLIQIGTPGQPVRLIPGTSATAATTTWTVIPQGCSLANPGLADCPGDRGYLFHSNESTSWSTEGLSNSDTGVLFSLYTWVEEKLGLNGSAYYGWDTVSLGLPGSGLPTLQHQLIAGYADNDFWLGSLGLSPWPSNFTDFNQPIPSLLSTLHNQSLIPSRSWGYTAGAYYHDPPVFGSLTLGGYDSARSSPSSNITLPFGPDISRDLLVSLDAITFDTAGSSPLLASSVNVFIDSMVTDLWLPVSVCSAFEQQLGLVWNSTAGSYLLDEQKHEALLAQNPTFTFSLGNGNGSDAVDIVFPYAAFDLEMSPPLVNTTTRYFPLKRAEDEEQYVLGRTFLQEAYVFADYERRHFTVSQARFRDSGTSSHVVSIYAPGQGGDGGLSKGTIAAIALGSVSAVGLAALAAHFIRRWRMRKTLVQSIQSVSEAQEKRREDHHGLRDSLIPGSLPAPPTELDSRDSWLSGYQSHRKLKHLSELDDSQIRRELESPEPVIAELEARARY